MRIGRVQSGLSIGAQQLRGNGIGLLGEKLCSLHIANRGIGKLGLQPFEDGDGVCGSAGVIAQQDMGLFGQRTDDGDLDADGL